jgi:hypothetical protein
VHKDKLYLLKIEVNLVEGASALLPGNANREIICRYENMWRTDEEGTKKVVTERRFEFLVFHDLFIPYTGDLFLTYPDIDLWEQPISEDDEEERCEELRLIFRRGVLTDKVGFE